MFKKIVLYSTIVILFLAIVVAGTLGFLVNREYKKILADPNFPSFEVFEQNPKLATIIIDRDNETICEIGKERRILTSFAKIPKCVVRAFVSIEDKRYWEHDGADYKGVLAVAWNTYVKHQKPRGASTLDMQLIKNRFFPDRRKEKKEEREYRKKIEIVSALKLETELTAKLGGKLQAKERIAELYFNQISFGRDRFGIEEGARQIFGKSVSDLNVLEAAALAAMPKDPSAYDPIRHPQKNRARRLTVLREMKTLGNISEDDIKAVFAEYAPKLAPKKIPVLGIFEQDFKTLLGLEPITVVDANPYRGTAQNICDMAKDQLRKKHCAGMNIKKLKEKEQCEERMSNLGIVIRSSVSQKLMAKVSRLAENTVATIKERHEMLRKNKERPQVAVVVIDNETGEIPVLISGAPYFAGGFNFVNGDRQPGSLMKLFVYYAGLRYAGLSPASVFLDSPVSMMNNKPWPANYEPGSMGSVSLTSAFAHSANTIAVKVLIAAGPKNVVRAARELGVTSELKPDLSLALGTYGISPMEIAGAYATFARGGTYIKPMIFTEIGGENMRDSGRLVISPAYEEKTKDLLYAVVESGTGKKVQGIVPGRIGGKTGTTSGHADAWFAGFSRRYTIVVWVGFEKRTTLGAKETGAGAALPLWGDTLCILENGESCGLVAGMSRKKVDDKEDRQMVDESVNEEIINDAIENAAQNETVNDEASDEEPDEVEVELPKLIKAKPTEPSKALEAAPKNEPEPEDETEALIKAAEEAAEEAIKKQ